MTAFYDDVIMTRCSLQQMPTSHAGHRARQRVAARAFLLDAGPLPGPSNPPVGGTSAPVIDLTIDSEREAELGSEVEVIG